MKIQKDQIYWDERFKKNGIFSTGYTDNFIHKYDDKVRWKVFLKEVKLNQGEKILDVGCNYGPWSIRLAKKNMNVTGIDIVKDAIEIAKKNASNESLKINFYNVGIENASFKDREFDKIISITVLQHIMNDKKYLKSLINIKRQLKKDGKFLMIESAPNKKIDEKLRYKRERTMLEQIKFCEQAGLKLIKSKGVFNLSVKWYYGVKKFSLPIWFEKIIQYCGVKILNPLDFMLSRSSIFSRYSNLKLMIYKIK